MKKPIVNIADVELRPFAAPIPEELQGTFGCRMAMIGPAIGAQKLGYNVTAVAPGRRAFPFHSHRANEEMFFVLEGEGELRIGSERHAIKKGDFIACPPGGAETAHQIINTGSAELKYLAVSTKITPEIAEYPDSKKFGVLAENFRFVSRADLSLGYFDGEPPATKS
ncbi:MAG TPA: cupin domain-containing protein [Labilithrix sp.]